MSEFVEDHFLLEVDHEPRYAPFLRAIVRPTVLECGHIIQILWDDLALVDGKIRCKECWLRWVLRDPQWPII